MGGASSLYSKTDWEKADGKLTESDVTLDGNPPTTKYTVVYLVKKRAVNHREYDVTDGGMNLLFTTQVVPGTICCFDVLGPGIDEFLFRIMVDIGRRYWIVYRYDVPAFEGQIPDQVESDKASTQLERPVKLYKKCCVTVSWSRYMSVAAFYGPPTVDMLMTASSIDEDEVSSPLDGATSAEMDEEEDDAEDLFQQASRIATRMRERTSSADSGDLVVQPSLESLESSPATETTGKQPGTEMIDEEERSAHETDETKVGSTTSQNDRTDISHAEQSAKDLPLSSSPSNTLRSSPSNTKDDASTGTDSIASSSVQSAQRATLIASASAASIRSWFRQKSENIREKSLAYLYSTTNAKHPLEGVIHLDKPLILCQEIYNRLIGNHQTSVVSKERVLELLKQDAAQHFKEHPDEKEDYSNSEDPILTVRGKLVIPDVEDEEASPGDGTEECKEARDVVATESETQESKRPTDDQADDPQTEPEESKEQPLVGYWNWEHSLRSQKMKMHLAKGTDQALHVVIAIIVNQVRYERNALAMTI